MENVSSAVVTFDAGVYSYNVTNWELPDTLTDLTMKGSDVRCDVKFLRDFCALPQPNSNSCLQPSLMPRTMDYSTVMLEACGAITRSRASYFCPDITAVALVRDIKFLSLSSNS